MVEFIERIIRKLDPSLKYVGELNPSSVLVYIVKRDNKNYVLKMAKENDSDSIDHLIKERRNLTLSKNVKGITHLIETLKDTSGCKLPLIKEYVSGKIPYDILGKINPNLKFKLEETVRELHDLGLVGLDLYQKNMIIPPKGEEIYLIDLGAAQLVNQLDNSRAETLRSRDLRLIDQFEWEIQQQNKFPLK